MNIFGATKTNIAICRDFGFSWQLTLITGHSILDLRFGHVSDKNFPFLPKFTFDYASFDNLQKSVARKKSSMKDH